MQQTVTVVIVIFKNNNVTERLIIRRSIGSLTKLRQLFCCQYWISYIYLISLKLFLSLLMVMKKHFQIEINQSDASFVEYEVTHDYP